METQRKTDKTRKHKMTKAWVANFIFEDWVMLVHGENANKAKRNFWNWNPEGNNGYADYTEIRVKRVPGLDNLPITFDNAKKAGFSYYDVDNMTEQLGANDFINDCDCDLCIFKNE